VQWELAESANGAVSKIRANADDEVAPNIVLSSTQQIPASGDTPAAERRVKVTVSGRTGMLEAIELNGVNILASHSIVEQTHAAAPGAGTLSPEYEASRIHMHRASTDNDTFGGYKDRWAASGLNKNFVYSRNKKIAIQAAGILGPGRQVRHIKNGAPVDGTYEMKHVTVTRAYGEWRAGSNRDKDKEGIGNAKNPDHESPRGSGAQGVTCSWRMRPESVNYSKLRLIHQVQSFHENSTQQQALVPVRNLVEEKFVHMLAGSLMLGRESILKMMQRSPSKDHLSSLQAQVQQSKSSGSSQRKPSPAADALPVKQLHVMVKLWKPTLLLESTIPKAESQKGYHNSINNNAFAGSSSSSSSRSNSQNAGLSAGSRGGQVLQSNGYSNNTTGYINTNAQYMDIIGSADRIFLFEQRANDEKPCPVPEQQVNDDEAYYDSDEDAAGAPSSFGHIAHGIHAHTRRSLAITLSVTYLMDNTGTLHMRARLDSSSLIVPLPRVGIQLQLNKQIFDTVTWQGQGPHECYPDRKGSTVLATHCAPILSMGTPYIVPGENGNRTDVSWIQLLQQRNAKATSSSAKGANDKSANTNANMCEAGTRSNDIVSGFRIDCASSFNFSVQEHTTEDLDQAKHSTSLEAFPRPFLSLNLDPFLMGVGGDDSWTACVHGEYMLPPDEPYEFELSFSFL